MRVTPQGARDPGRRRLRGRNLLRPLIVDISPVREHRRYRWLLGSQLVSYLGRQFTVVAIPYQVFLITESTLLVGAVGLVQVAPTVVFSVLGGSLADAGDRRRLLVVLQLLSALTAAGLAVNAALGEPAIWPLFALAAVSAGLSAVDGPTRHAVVPSLVARHRLPAAYALHQTLVQTGQVAGPAIAGAAIAYTDFAVAYWLQALIFVISALLVVPVGRLVPAGGGRRAGFRSIAEGVRYLNGQSLIKGLLLLDLVAMVLSMPRALFPAIGTDVLGGDAATVGLLYAAPGVGALIGAVTSGWVGQVEKQGRAVLFSVIAWGLAVVAFGLSRVLLLSLVMLAVAGAADVISAVFRNTILQMSAPDELRGRLSSLQTAVSASGPRIGDGQAGALGALTTPTVAVLLGGAACVVGSLVLVRRFPVIWTYRRSVDPEEKEPVVATDIAGSEERAT